MSAVGAWGAIAERLFGDQKMTDTVLNFEDLSRGDIVNNQFSAAGVTISSTNPNNPPMIFDTSNPTGGDTDLATNNLGNVLILSEDGDSSDPDDNAGGGTLRFTFDEPTTVNNLTVLDADGGIWIKLYDVNGNLIRQIDVSTPDNGQEVVQINTDGVAHFDVILGASGAIDNISFEAITPELDGIVQGDDGNDVINAAYLDDPQGDRIDNNDEILSGEGAQDDIVDAGAGNDSIAAGAGNDDIIAGSGDDILRGDAGDDILDGGEGTDTLFGGNGDDVAFGGDGGDRFELSRGEDIAEGGNGNDDIWTGLDDDIANGQDGDDIIDTSSGDDLIAGGAGDDTITAGEGDDLVFGDQGSENGQSIGQDATPVQLNFSDLEPGSETRPTATDIVGDSAIYNNVATLEDGTVVSARLVLVGTSSDDLQIDVANGDNHEILLNGNNDASQEGETATFRLEFYNQETGEPVVINSSIVWADVDQNVGQEIVTIDAGEYDSYGVPADSSLDVVNSNGTITASGTEDNIDPNELDSQFGATFSGQTAIEFTLTSRGVNSGTNFGLFDDSFIMTDIVAEDGNDLINAGAGEDVVYGQGGEDSIDGGANDDTLFGGDDDDRIFGNDGNDEIFGGAGNDNLGGADFGDDTFFGGAGNDMVEASFGNDTLYGDAGNDELWASSDDDLVFGGTGDDSSFGGQGNDTVHGDEGDDILSGGSGSDTVFGGTGDDTIQGGGNFRDDQGVDGADSDVVDGGAGGDDFDTLDLTGQGAFRVVNETPDSNGNGINGTIEFLDADGNPTGDTFDFTEIENIIGNQINGGPVDGTAGDDLITPTSGAGGGVFVDAQGDSVDGGVDGADGDDDIINGFAGDDSIEGGAGDDTIFGGDDDDTIAGDAGANELFGGSGDDVFVGGDGADTFQGGAGQDNLDYSGSDEAVTVDLSTGDLSGGDADNDTIAGGIDGVIGSDFDDVLTGFDQQGSTPADTFTNELFGGEGNDVITGLGGDDLLEGGRRCRRRRRR